MVGSNLIWESKIIHFFGERMISSPKVKLPHPTLEGFWEYLRPEMHQRGGISHVEILEGDIYESLKSKVYKIFADQGLVLSSVLALWEDKLLWLDDHSSNSDYNEFIKHERLFELCANHTSTLANFIIETKLNFLCYPRLISSVEDVPRIPAYLREGYEKRNMLDVILDREKRLSDLAGIIHAPKILVEKDRIEIQLYLWTETFGRIFRIFYTLYADYHIEYTGNKIGEGLGLHFPPK